MYLLLTVLTSRCKIQICYAFLIYPTKSGIVCLLWLTRSCFVFPAASFTNKNNITLLFLTKLVLIIAHLWTVCEWGSAENNGGTQTSVWWTGALRLNYVVGKSTQAFSVECLLLWPRMTCSSVFLTLQLASSSIMQTWDTPLRFL